MAFKQFAEILAEHRADVFTYDAYYIEGCEAPDCDFTVDGGSDTAWDAYYSHLSEILIKSLGLDKVQCVEHMDGDPGDMHLHGGYYGPHNLCIPDKEKE